MEAMCQWVSIVLFFLSFLHLTRNQTDLCLENEELRLVGGATTSEGRVEICINHRWGTICNNLWDNLDAQVVCRQLMLPTRSATAVPSGYFRPGSGQIWLDNVQCNGGEAKLLFCSSSEQGLSNCDHDNDAGVICLSDPVCEFGDVRLAAGLTDLYGRVEICVDNAWGTICDPTWRNIDATVVCRQLGHSSTGAVALSSDQILDGTGQIWLEDVHCAGTESRLINCPSSPIGSQNCNHNNDVGVICQPSTPVCTEGDVRLSSLIGVSSLEGRVEVCRRNSWGTICDRSSLWGIESATVVCRQLGYSAIGAQSAMGQSNFGVATGDIQLDNVQCLGSERRLVDCPSSSTVPANCTHREDVGVRCQPLIRCNQGSVRLVGGRTPSEGRVEICDDNEWGTVCDDSWGSPDAAVVCLQLQLPSSAAIAVSRAGFGRANNTVRIVLDNVRCVGNEMDLLSCWHSPLGVHNCGHREDAGVICQGSLATAAFVKGAVRLAGGTSGQEGRVEVFKNNQWGTVCGILWDRTDASVVCRQLGYSPFGAEALGSAVFGGGIGQIWITNVQCIGNESRLFDCTYVSGVADFRCDHNEDVGVRCRDFDTLGPSSNLHVVYSIMNCRRVFITWDPPDDERAITGYSINLTILAGRTSSSGILFSGTNSLELTSLTCCAGYSYSVTANAMEPGVPSDVLMFRTLPNITDRIIVVARALNDTAITLQWTTPESVIRQQVNSYNIGVTSECYTNEFKRSQTFNIVTSNRNIHKSIYNLEPFIPYRIRVNVTICNSIVPVYNHIIYTQIDHVAAATITRVSREMSTSVDVRFHVPLSERNADYFEISYYNYSGSSFNPRLIINTIQTTNRSLIIHNLESCLQYWVTVTSVNCGSRIDSSPERINLKEPKDFQISIMLGKNEHCESWITRNNRNLILLDIKRGIREQLASDDCNLNVSCIANDRLDCESGRTSNMVEFQATLVSLNGLSSEEQVSCLNRWVSTVGKIEIQGKTLPIMSPGMMTMQSNGLAFVWVLLALVLTGIIIAIPVIILASLCKRMKIRGNVQEMDETAGREARVTENKLYKPPVDHPAQETTETEVMEESEASSTSFSSRKFQMGKSYPIDFDPPDY